MTTLTVEIDRKKDLPALKSFLTRLGLKYKIEEDEWSGLSEAEIKGIKIGLKDVEAGRLHTHSEVADIIEKKIIGLRSKNA
ncbi:MAG: hypothetical protein WKF68_13670 [Daejeonella sp.]